PPLHSEKIVGERKIFFLDLKENDRGRFIKITEDVRGRRDTIMLPMEHAEEFLDALQRTLQVAREME
ncbi:MAG TPA: DNA-binding protein, partial [Verrucomicrobium sp.]|nr:DNA-binding protein [Verrucomicrobium sp.]